MKTLLVILGCCLCLNFSSFGQSEPLECGSESPNIIWENEFQRLIAQSAPQTQKEGFLRQQYSIPVVFHIIHGGETIGAFPNILKEQIASQLTVINQDFNSNAYNAGSYPALAFVNWANNQNIPAANRDQYGRIKIADFNITFCLATTDPTGRLLPEPGIDRINYTSKGWPNPTQYATQATMKSYLDNILKPRSIWDPDKYLNVWVTDKSAALTYAGVSSAPPFSGLKDIPNSATDSTDGIWCFAKAIGSVRLFPGGTYIGPGIDGRTLTHEIGHYLGLRHIWGDSSCGNDFCEDTPPAAGQNSGLPTYPHDVGSCTNPANNPDGEMFMNYMDYTAGPAKYMFTTDQMIRAHTALQNSPLRKKLGSHSLCSSLSATTLPETDFKPRLYPNPGSGEFKVSMRGQVVKSTEVYNHLGNLLKVCEADTCSIVDLPPGIYIIVVQTEVARYGTRYAKI